MKVLTPKDIKLDGTLTKYAQPIAAAGIAGIEKMMAACQAAASKKEGLSGLTWLETDKLARYCAQEIAKRNAAELIKKFQ